MEGYEVILTEKESIFICQKCGHKTNLYSHSFKFSYRWGVPSHTVKGFKADHIVVDEANNIMNHELDAILIGLLSSKP